MKAEAGGRTFTITAAMLRALEVLELGPARYTNYTARGAMDPDDNELGRGVYWQSADQLAAAGLAVIEQPFVDITIAGRNLLTAWREIA